VKEKTDPRDNIEPYSKAYHGSLAVFAVVFAIFLLRLSFINLPEIKADDIIEPDILTDTEQLRAEKTENVTDSQKITPEKNIINDLTVQKKLVNINSALGKELCSLKGIGSKTAEAIIEYRNENGRFKCKEDLMKVKGIGKKKYSVLKDKIIL